MNTTVAPAGIRLSEFESPSITPAVAIGRMQASAIPDLIARTHAEPDQGTLFMQMFYILQALGQDGFALEMQARALAWRRHYRIAGSISPTIRLLALAGPGDKMDNIPMEYLVENADISLDFLYLLPGEDLPDVIPDHDVAIVAVCESDRNRMLLGRLEDLVAHWPRPVLNLPGSIRHCARDEVFRLLHEVPNLLVPETRRCRRTAARPAEFPVTIRPVDTHAGNGLAKIANDAELDAYLAAHSDEEFHVAAYVDYRSDDGLFRKARIALIDGKPYICHFAISSNWIVHYISADMQSSSEKRVEEAALMEHFEQDFAARHHAALRAIADSLALDYVVIDCGETKDGRLLLFEADIGGWIHAIDPVDVFPYKPPVMQKAFDAFRNMLVDRMQSHINGA